MAENLEDLTPEQIAEEINRRGVGGEAEPPPVEAESPEPVEVEVEPEPEPVAEPEPEPEAAAPDPLAELRERLELQEAQLAAERERARHFQVVLSRRTNEIHRLKQRPPEADSESFDSPPEEERPLPRGVSERLDALDAERLERGIERVDTAVASVSERLRNETSSFWEALKSQPEALQSEFDSAWKKRLQEEAISLGYAEARQRGDAKLAEGIARVAYTTALAETRGAFKGRFNPNGDQTARLKEKKLAAASGTSGARSTARPKQPQSLDEVSVEDIAAEINRRERLRRI